MQALHNTPGKLFMLIRTLVLGLALAAPLLAQAAQTIDNSTLSCTQSLVAENISSLTFSCEGDMTVTGGTWTSDTLISLTSTGTLFLQNVSFNAPSITLSGLSIDVDSRAHLQAKDEIRIQTTGGTGGQAAGELQIEAGAQIDLGGNAVLVQADPSLRAVGDIRLRAAIPEPETDTLALAALAILGSSAALARRRKA
jgi:hypothetical protein